MKKSLFTMALVAAGAVIYLLSKDKEEEISETPEIRLIDLKKDNNESENHHDSTEDLQEENEAPAVKQENKSEIEPEKEEPVLSQEESFSDLMDELQQELHHEPSVEEEKTEAPVEELPQEEVAEEVKEEEIEEVQEEPALETIEDLVSKETPESLSKTEEAVDTEEVKNEENKIDESELNEQHEEVEESLEMVEEVSEPDFSEEAEAEQENSTEVEEEENNSVIKDLQGKILNEVEQEIKDNSFGDFVRRNEQKEEEPRYSGTVYEVSDLYPYLSYEMIDKILDANIGFNHVYHDNQPIKIIHRVGFDKIEDLIEFVILIKEHDYRVEENNGLDMISISKELVVEDTIIFSDIFNVSNQVYRLHGHYQGYEIVEQ